MPVSVNAPSAPGAALANPASNAAWEKARAMGDIQFAPLNPPPIKPPAPPPQWLIDWMRWLAGWFAPIGRWLVLHWRAIEITAAVAVVVVAAWIAWRIVLARVPRPPTEQPPAWQPDAGQAVALLADADALAHDGQYDAAVHLLLRRSFDAIAAARPEWLTPASTAREIAGLPALPAPARAAFGVISQAVERSRYALRPLAAPDWHSARAAYAGFAVPDTRGA